ncbi:MAG: hypothetical protein H2174_00380 [Vampirovibrio sp.]|nr:hypothetical protein [Vampirovibrio sp.]
MLPQAYQNDRYKTNIRPAFSTPNNSNNSIDVMHPQQLLWPFAPLNADKSQPYALPFATTQRFQAQYGSPPLMYNNQSIPSLLRKNSISKNSLQQRTQSGSNIVQAKKHNGSVDLDQQAQYGQSQGAYFDGLKGHVKINQQGRSQQGQETLLKDVAGNTAIQSINFGGDVNIQGSNLKGKVAIVAGTNTFDNNEIHLKDLWLGGSINTTGNSDITVDNAQENIQVAIQGRQGQAEEYHIKVSNVQSDKINSIRIEGQKEDSAWVDLASNTNASEVFLQGIKNNIFIEGKNNQKDIIHVEGDAILNLTQLDDTDTVVTHLADGRTVSKSVAELNEMKLLRSMTPSKAVQLLKDNFGAFESLLDTDKNRKDNLASFDELVAYTKLPTADPNIKAAAQYFIDHRAETFDKMEGLNDYGRKNGIFSLDEMTKFGQVLNGTLAMPTPKTAAEIQQIEAIKNMNGKTAATILKDNFVAFESLMDNDKNRKDNIAQFGELVAYTQLTTADPLIKAAAQYFMDHRAETFDKMEGINDRGRKDGIFSLDEMTKFAAQG